MLRYACAVPKGTTMTKEEKQVDETDVSLRAEDAVADQTVEQWLAIRKEAGLQIDPETAEVLWVYAQTLDPYGVDPELPEEYRQIGREYFARSPGSDVWVWFGDLPDATRSALLERHKRKLAYPAGLPKEFLNGEMSTESCVKTVASGSWARAAAILQGRPKRSRNRKPPH
jgi:hypothetical protein